MKTDAGLSAVSFIEAMIKPKTPLKFLAKFPLVELE
jgi:hypothetical protein